MWRVAVTLGGLLWMLTIVASGTMNAVAGYALGRSEIEGYIFGALGVAADGWKALGPIYIMSLIRGKMFIHAAVAIVTWFTCFVFAVTAAIGLAAQNRLAATGGREAISIAYTAVTSELAELRGRNLRQTEHRSVGEIEATVAAVLARSVSGGGTVATVSKECMGDVSRTRTACAEVAGLRVSLAAAVDTDRLNRRIRELIAEEERLSSLGGTSNPDPQGQLLVRLSRGIISREDVGLGLVLILVTMVELMSGFAPAVLTEVARAERIRASAASRQSTNSDVTVLRLIGDVFEYMADCIRPAPGMKVAIGDVVASYQQWCQGRDCIPLCEDQFLQQFEKICADDLQRRVRKDNDEFEGMRLVGLIGHLPN